MAYTTANALTTLNRYLGISESAKSVIPNTKERGFVLKLASGEQVVIFVYPLVHKQDNTKNYFDTRDSGGVERGITWNYAISKNLKYFCLGVNDAVPKFRDYVFSLECSEQIIEKLSGTKNGVRAGQGNQIIIPNNYVPKKDFERITNRLGTFIAVIKKDRLMDYLTTCDNRPYMLDPKAVNIDERIADEEAEEEKNSAYEEYVEMSLDERKEMFYEWMRKQIKPLGKPYGGKPYSESVSKNYATSLEVDGEKLKDFPYENNFFFYTELTEFVQVQAAAKSAPNFDEVNKNRINKGFTCAMDRYVEFLVSLGSEVDETEDEAEEESENKLKNCLENALSPRTRITHPLNFIIYGAPGTGKTYSTAEYALAIVENRKVDLRKKDPIERKAVMDKYKELVKSGRVVFTTFHQSYGYEEFIQGLRPDTESETMSFKTVDGIFKTIADRALNDADNDYVIIIDEINRANISKVFGELITLIEDDKRWGEVNELSATLQSGDPFAVPNNLYIVGTMNSADKSISLIDAALRRRFSFIEQRPEIDLVEDPILQAVLKEMNLLLAKKLKSTDLLVGHSYFINKKVTDLCDIMNNSIIPLLYEYFYDQRKRVSSLLDEIIAKTSAPIAIDDNAIGRLRVKEKTDGTEQV